jgi:AcrR family transcriptional regulator
MNSGSNTEPHPQRLRDRLREATSSAILEAAEEAFAESGLHATRMDEIAGRAGVSVGTLYNYFSDKSALLAALIDSRRKDLVGQLDQVLAEHSGEPFAAQLEAVLRTLLAHFEAHQRFLSILMEGEHARDAQAMPAAMRPRETMRVLYSRFEALVERGLATGRLRPECAALYPALLMGMLRGVLVRTLYETNPPGSLVQRAPQLVDIFLNGARKNP